MTIKNKKIAMLVSMVLGLSITWRGIWGIMDLYVFPENKLASYIISITAGLIFLSLNNFGLKENN